MATIFFLRPRPLPRPRPFSFSLSLFLKKKQRRRQTQPASPTSKPSPSSPARAAAAAAETAAKPPSSIPAAPAAAPPPSGLLPLPPPPPRLDRAQARAAANRAAAAAKAAWEEARAAGKPSPVLGSLLVEPSWRAALSRAVPGISSSADSGTAPPAPSSSSASASASAAALQSFLEREWASAAVFPPPWLVFRALNEVPLHAARVVVIGQDPYHGPGQAEGLSFSVPRGQAMPPSLRNIHKELLTDVKAPRPSHGSLAKWAEQGVLLLNATLTVRRGQANSHQGKGWDAVTDAAVAALLQRETPAVFLLWGKFAEKKALNACRPGLWNKRHVLLKAPHPSGLSASRGFFGCEHFSKCNEALERMGGEAIDWDLSRE